MSVLMEGAKIGAERARILWKLNACLANEGLPFYWKRGNHITDVEFEEDYRLYPPPRYVGTWKPPFYKMVEVYLTYKPGTSDQKDIVYKVQDDTLWVYDVGEHHEP